MERITEGVRRILITISAVVGLALFFYPGLSLWNSAQAPQGDISSPPDPITKAIYLRDALLTRGWRESGYKTFPSEEDRKRAVAQYEISIQCLLQQRDSPGRLCNQEEALQSAIFVKWGEAKAEEANFSYTDGYAVSASRLAEVLGLSDEGRDAAISEAQSRIDKDLAEIAKERSQYLSEQMSYLALSTAPLWLLALPFLASWVGTKVFLWIRRGFATGQE